MIMIYSRGLLRQYHQKLKPIWMKTKLPVKKKKGKELGKKERRYNKKPNRERVVIEHSIRRIKTFNIWGITQNI